jgi:hypothetical protein
MYFCIINNKKMKNQIIIDIDTEREKPLLIGKGADYQPPATKEEAQEMIINDIACVCDTMISLIHIADQNSYGNKKDLVNKAIKVLNQYLTLPTTPQPVPPDTPTEPTDNKENG